MKSLTIAFSVILLLAGLSVGFSTLAQPTRIPHENPLTAETPPDDPVSLLRFYTNVFDRINAREYLGAQNTLEQVNHVNIHPQLRDIIDALNRPSNQLAATLNNLEALHYEASSLFSQQQNNEARQKLDDAEATVQSAQLLLEDVKAATNTLADRLGVLASPEHQVREPYDRLQDTVNRLGQLISELNQLRENLIEDPQAVITTSFYYPTHLEVSAPESAHPGIPITVSGRVSSTGVTVDRTVRVLLDDTQLAEEMTRGQFSLQVTPPRQISTGKHRLSLVAVPREHYSGASTSLPIYISAMPIETEIQAPQTIILPKSAQISGQVHHDLGPLPDARVELKFKGRSSVVKTAADGSFTTSIKTSFDLSLLGSQELTIIIEPVEPWYASLVVKRRILTINLLSSGLMLVATISLGLMLFSRVRISLPRPPGNGLTIETRPREPLILAPVPEHKFESADTKGRILSAYLIGLEAVVRVTGISIAPHTTLREYLNAVTPRLIKAVEPFSELTTIAENALYSAHELDKNTAARAERLANSIMQELSSGTA